ncbi:MAG TPA: hypothetical protein G4N96_10930 [Chloroflexi bacterium]|nr:MAG: hypothetical protein B6243_02230 [Anaerolineaceae bacterium 4572_5.2]HEY85609.1 hypothetical protein [Chloroflexota bacterium]
MSFAGMFLGIVALLAFLIIIATIIAIIVIMRRPDASSNQPSNVETLLDADTSTPDTLSSDLLQTATPSPTPQEDIKTYLARKKQELVEFELEDLSNSFQGTTSGTERYGVILHLSQEDTPLVTFRSHVPGPQNGAIIAETVYGEMKIVIGQGKAGIQWDGELIGVLDFSKQRILGTEGQILGSMERPLPDSVGLGEVNSYPVSFFGEKAADVTMIINALSALRWFGNEDTDRLPAFENLSPIEDDNQTLLLVGALLLEIAFFSML